MQKSDMTHDEWLAWRRGGITGSDAWHLLEGCKRRIWYDKTGAPPDYPVVETPQMRAGKELEALVAKRAGKELKATIRMRNSCWVAKDAECVRATIDGLGFPYRRTEPAFVWECKTVSLAEWKRIAREPVRDAWLFQLQHYLAVLNTHYKHIGAGVLTVFCRDSHEMLSITIGADFEGVIPAIFSESERVMRAVENGPIPDRTDNERLCAGCLWRRTCLQPERLAAVDAMETSDVAAMPERPDLTQMFADYAEASSAASEWADTRDRIKASIIEATGGAEARCSLGYTRRVHGGTRLDGRMVEAKYPDVYKECQKRSADYVRIITRDVG